MCDIYLEASIFRFGAETNKKQREWLGNHAKELNANKKANYDGWFNMLYTYLIIGPPESNDTNSETSVIYKFRKKFITWRDIISKKESSNENTDASNKEKKDDGGWF